MAKVLNMHLTDMEHLSTRACERFSAGELQTLSRQLYGVADPALLEVYEETQDRRRQTYGSEDEMQADYTRLNGLVADREPRHRHENEGPGKREPTGRMQNCACKPQREVYYRHVHMAAAR